MALGLAGKSLWFGFAASWGRGLERDLELSPVSYPAPPKRTKVINPGPLLEKGTVTLTLRSVVLWPLQYSALAVGTEGRQAVWSCRPGQKPRSGGMVSQNAVTACILLSGHHLPCTVPVKHLSFHP